MAAKALSLTLTTLTKHASVFYTFCMDRQTHWTDSTKTVPALPWCVMMIFILKLELVHNKHECV